VSQAGVLICATDNGIFAYEVDADSVDEITALGFETGYFQTLKLYAMTLLPATVSDVQIAGVIQYFEEELGATRNPTGDLSSYWASRSDLVTPKLDALDFSGATNFYCCWHGCSSLEEFPGTLDLSSGTNFSSCWQSCSSLEDFPSELDLSSGTDFSNCWRSCSLLESFPGELDLSSGTNFYRCWRECSSLEEFPGDLDLSSGTNFTSCWYACSSLESFPGDLDLSSGTSFYYCWGGCTSLEDFPANFFDYWTPGTPATNCFVNAWDGCSSLTATSVENILNSIATSGVDAPASGPDITIDYDDGTGTPDITSAVATLKACSPAWTITLNGVAQ